MAEKADWSKMKPSEVEALILDLAKKGNQPERIGLILRDQHGIPKVKLLGLKVNKVLAKHNLAVNSGKINTEKKIKKLKVHFAKNKHDYKAQRKEVMYAARLKKIERIAAK